MDTYSCIASPDIAEYCEKIGHTFNPFEMAALIDTSYRTIAEKHIALRKIIAECPDMELPNMDCDGSRSLHKRIKDMIEYEEYVLEIFKTPEKNAVYSHYDLMYHQSLACNDVFSDFQTALTDAKEFYKYDYPEVSIFEINKSFINEKNMGMKALFKNDDSLDCVQMIGSHHQYTQAPDKIGDSYIFNTYIDIPMPFKRGDILMRENDWYRINRERNIVISVVESIDCKHETAATVTSEELLHKTKIINALYVDKNGDLCYDRNLASSKPYEKLEYYRGELTGRHRILYYFSLYLRGEIHLPEFLSMQQQIKLEHQRDTRIDDDSHAYTIVANSDLPESINVVNTERIWGSGADDDDEQNDFDEGIECENENENEGENQNENTSNKFKIILDDLRAGWAYLRIEDGKQSMAQHVSYLRDSLAGLVDAAIRLANGQNSVVSFELEPEVMMWKIELVQDNCFDLYVGDLIFHDSVERFIKQVLNIFYSYSFEYSEDEYLENWKFDFPRKKLEELMALLQTL